MMFGFEELRESGCRVPGGLFVCLVLRSCELMRKIQWSSLGSLYVFQDTRLYNSCFYIYSVSSSRYSTVVGVCYVLRTCDANST